MTSAEFTELMCFEELEGPLGLERDDFRFAQVAAVIANANRDQKKKRKPFESKDFMIDWEKHSGHKATPSPQDVEAKMKTFFAGVR